jgi:hypothetical protein
MSSPVIACFWRLFFCFGWGRPLHKVQSLTFHNPKEIPTAHFRTSNLRVCLRVSYNVFLLSRRSSCYRPWSLFPCCTPGVSILYGLLLQNCPWRPFPLRSAGMAQHVNRPQAAANFFWDNHPGSISLAVGPTARCQSPYRSPSAPIVSIAASYFRTSWCSAMNLISSGFASIFSG